MEVFALIADEMEAANELRKTEVLGFCSCITNLMGLTQHSHIGSQFHMSHMAWDHWVSHKS